MHEAITEIQLPRDYERTLIIDPYDFDIGGSVFNITWYLAQLGLTCTTISHYGREDRMRVVQFFSRLNTTSSYVVEKSSSTDLLVVAPSIEMPAVYILGHIIDEECSVIVSHLPADGVIIYSGSRHSTLREKFIDHILLHRQLRMVFAPSYTLYDHTKEETLRLLKLSSIAIVNEKEAKHLERIFPGTDIDAIMRVPREGGIVTLGSNGADLYFGSASKIRVASKSGRQADVIGAGDAFLCAFLVKLMAGNSWQESGEAASAIAAQVVLDGRVRAVLHGHGF
jgi:sugar/nucleoside kinase (ribokinase family)